MDSCVDPISGLRGMPPTGGNDLYPQGLPGCVPGFSSNISDPSVELGPGLVIIFRIFTIHII